MTAGTVALTLGGFALDGENEAGANGCAVEERVGDGALLVLDCAADFVELHG